MRRRASVQDRQVTCKLICNSTRAVHIAYIRVKWQNAAALHQRIRLQITSRFLNIDSIFACLSLYIRPYTKRTSLVQLWFHLSFHFTCSTIYLRPSQFHKQLKTHPYFVGYIGLHISSPCYLTAFSLYGPLFSLSLHLRRPTCTVKLACSCASILRHLSCPIHHSIFHCMHLISCHFIF